MKFPNIIFVGDYKLSPHKFEVCGGIDPSTNESRLEKVEMKISGASLNRYHSSVQPTVETGLLHRMYVNLYKHLNCYYTASHPTVTLNEFLTYFQLFSFSLTASGVTDKQMIPLVQSGTCSLFFNFKNPTSANSLQNMYVMGIFPSLLEMDSDRRFIASYRTS